MASLSNAYDYVIAACRDPNIGYSQDMRKTITLGVDYKTYCDCSSLMSKAMTVGGYFKNNPWFATSNERSYLSKAGWQKVDIDGEWKPGDILWRSGHTEMVYSGGAGKGVTMGAHTYKKAFANQVSINSFTSNKNTPWSELWRDPSGGAVDIHKWHMSNSYLAEYGDDMSDNAYMVWQHFNSLGFSSAAIAGLMGNMQRESTINPGVWQSLTVGSGGYGLVQWTPASGWFDWAADHNIDTSDADESGDGQCDCINDCVAQGQWIPTSAYPYSWSEYAALTDHAEATKAFLYEYERAGVEALDDRLRYAAYWYEVIESGVWDGDSGGGSLDLQLKCGIINELQRRLWIPGRH